MKLLINILLLIAVFTFGTAHADDNVFRAQFTTQISNKEPTDNIKQLENVFTSIYFFTDIRECTKCKVEHVWYLNGEKVYTRKSVAKYPRYRTWSKKTLNDSTLGTWTVKVKIDGQVRVVRKMSYFAPTQVQRKQAPVQQRIQLNDLSECEHKLEHFNKMTSEEPENPYYKFMLNKWGSRCYGE